MFTGNEGYRWYLVTKALQNVIFERFRKGESAAGEKKQRMSRRNMDFEFIFVLCPPQADFLGFSTLTKDMDTPPVGEVGSEVYGK